VLAMNATLEGRTTAHYIAERLEAAGAGSPTGAPGGLAGATGLSTKYA
jgi:recombinational DNA repair protein RecR